MQLLNGWSTKDQVVHAEKVSTSKQHHEVCDDWPSYPQLECGPVIKKNKKQIKIIFVKVHAFISLSLE